MNRQRSNRRVGGFITLPLMAWGAIAAAVVIAGLLIAVKVQSARLDSVKSEYATFKAQVEANGRIAEANARAQEAKDKQNKEKADAENKRTTDSLRVAIKRLRDANDTSGGSMSGNPPGSRCPDGQTCFDTALYRGADGEFVKGARGLADEGSQVETDLNTARSWAQSR